MELFVASLGLVALLWIIHLLSGFCKQKPVKTVSRAERPIGNIKVFSGRFINTETGTVEDYSSDPAVKEKLREVTLSRVRDEVEDERSD
jgi:hypothetical protein